MIKIAIYGKGGIGKSTTTSNIAAALAVQGYKVMQIGCDPKSDSVKNLVGGKKITTILDRLREDDSEVKLEDIVFEGFAGVKCVEAGGPTPGIGCAGRGIITAFEKLEELNAYEIYKPDVVLYGEMLPDDTLNKACLAISNADLLIVAGTSLTVEPAASMINLFKGKNLVILNDSKTPYDNVATLVIHADLKDIFENLKA